MRNLNKYSFYVSTYALFLLSVRETIGFFYQFFIKNIHITHNKVLLFNIWTVLLILSIVCIILGGKVTKNWE